MSLLRSWVADSFRVHVSATHPYFHASPVFRFPRGQGLAAERRRIKAHSASCRLGNQREPARYGRKRRLMRDLADGVFHQLQGDYPALVRLRRIIAVSEQVERNVEAVAGILGVMTAAYQQLGGRRNLRNFLQKLGKLPGELLVVSK